MAQPVKRNLLAFDCEVRRNIVQYKLPPHHNFGEYTKGEPDWMTNRRNIAFERIATEKDAVDIRPAKTEYTVPAMHPMHTYTTKDVYLFARYGTAPPWRVHVPAPPAEQVPPEPAETSSGSGGASADTIVIAAPAAEASSGSGGASADTIVIAPPTAPATCTAIVKSGKNKGQLCGRKTTAGTFCGKHRKIPTDEAEQVCYRTID